MWTLSQSTRVEVMPQFWKEGKRATSSTALGFMLLALPLTVIGQTLSVTDGTYNATVQKPTPDPDIGEVLSDEKHLVQKLLLRYAKVGTTGRPVKNATTSVQVSYGLGLIKMEVMEKDNMLSISAWTRYVWKDEYLTWDPADHGGIEDVKLPQTQIWTPDIMLYNTGITDKFEREAMAVISYDGTVRWFPQRIYHSSCSIDVRNFPFDNQTCRMLFGSWTHPIRELDIQLAFPMGIDLSTFQSDFRESSKWHIDDVVATRQIHGGNQTGFSVLDIELHLRRRMIFSSYILTFPVVFLSFLTLLVFWLPAGSTDKSELGLTIFGSLLLLLLILVEAAPPTASGVPLLGVYYCFNIIIVIMSIFLSSLVAKIGGAQKIESKRRVPPIIRTIFFRGFAVVLCVRRRSVTKNEEDIFGPKLSASSLSPGPVETSMPLDEYSCAAVRKLENLYSCSPAENEVCQEINRQLIELVDVLKLYMRGRARLERLQMKHAFLDAEWALLAEVLDKIFLILYLIVIISSLCFLFPR